MTLRFSSPDAPAGGVVTAPAAAVATMASPQDRFRDLMAVVTGAAGDHPVGCTVTAVASVSANPPLLLVSLAAASRTLRAIEQAGRFGICVLPVRRRDLAQAFATGDPATRFAGVGFDWVLGTPLLRGAVTGAVCAVRGRLAVADHVLVTGGPLWQAEELSADPVIWFRRDLWRLRPPDAPR